MVSQQDITIPNITIQIQSLDEEICYVWNRLKRIEFYNRFGYNLSLPETEGMKLIVNKAIKGTLDEQDMTSLRTELSEQYNELFYEKGLALVHCYIELAKSSLKLFGKYVKLWGFKLHSNYVVKLTRYGPGGSYDCDSGHIILKTEKERMPSKRNNPSEIIVHEITHIGIERAIVERFNLSHEIKERLVDQFIVHHFKDIFPDYTPWSKGDSRIDDYLVLPDSWERLPYYIEEFINEI